MAQCKLNRNIQNKYPVGTQWLKEKGGGELIVDCEGHETLKEQRNIMLEKCWRRQKFHHLKGGSKISEPFHVQW